MNPTFSRVTLLTLIVMVIVAFWESGRIKELEHQVQSAGANAAALQADLTAANLALDKWADQLENSRSRRVVVSADASRRGDDAQTQVFRAPQGPGSSDGLMGDPDQLKAMLTQMRGSLDGRYANLFRRLNLSPAALSQLKDLLVERQASTRDAFFASRTSGGVEPGSEAMRSLVEETQAEIDSGIYALLGDEKFQQYQHFNANRAEYALAEQLEQRLSYTQTPLSMAQADELVRIFNENQSTGAAAEARTAFHFVTADAAGRGGPVAAPGIFIGDAGAPILTDEALTQAGSILTPEQLAALQEIQAEQRAQQEMFEAMRSSIRGGVSERPPGNYTVEVLPPPGG